MEKSEIQSLSALQYQINSAINVCEGRLENGASPQDAIRWLQEESDKIFSGEVVYEEDIEGKGIPKCKYCNGTGKLIMHWFRRNSITCKFCAGTGDYILIAR